MEIRKSRSKRPLKQALKDITNNTSKKRKSRKSSKTHSKGSSNGRSELSESQSVEVQRSLEFYLSLKESQLLSLFSALKLNTENVKCRYKMIKKNHQKSLKKRVILSKIIRMTPLPEARLTHDLSPISLSESQLSASSLAAFLDNKGNPLVRPGNFDLERKLKSIEYETGKVIEQEFRLKERRRKITKEKSKIVVSIGILYEKKMLIQQGDKNIRKLQKKNRELAQQVQDLQKTLEKKRTASNSREFKKYQKMHSQVLVSDLNEKLEDRRENLRNLQEKFDRVSDVVRKRETYLKDILGIKAKILERVEKMKEFDRCFSSTKLVTTKMLNDSSTVTRVRSSFK